MGPIRSRMEVRNLIDRAQGLTSANVVSGIGAPPSARWQF